MPRRLTPLRALIGTLLLALTAGIFLALRTPRLTLANDAISVGYPPQAAVAPALCALALCALALARGSRRARVLSAGLALLLLVALVDGLRFRVSADSGGLVFRRLLSVERMTWDQVARVETQERALILTSTDGRRLVVGTRALPREHRTVLERTIARRLRECLPALRTDGTPR
jgi:hypothetical protein